MSEEIKKGTENSELTEKDLEKVAGGSENLFSSDKPKYESKEGRVDSPRHP